MKPQLTDQAGSIYQDRQVLLGIESEMKHDEDLDEKKWCIGWLAEHGREVHLFNLSTRD